MAACQAKLAAQRQALEVQLGGADTEDGAADGRGAVDDAGFQDLLGRRGQLQRQQEELARNLEQEPAYQAAVAQAGEALVACRTELAAKRRALVARLSSDGDDGRGAVDEAGFQDLLGRRGQLQQQGDELARNLEQEPTLKTAVVQAGEALTACKSDSTINGMC